MVPFILGLIIGFIVGLLTMFVFLDSSSENNPAEDCETEVIPLEAERGKHSEANGSQSNDAIHRFRL